MSGSWDECQFVDSSHLTFDVDLTPVPVGLYNIVVSNGCGSHKKGTGVGLLSVVKKIGVINPPISISVRVRSRISPATP